MSNTNNSNNFIELENQFILRMPSYRDGRLHPSTIALKEALNDDSLKERLMINLDTETRRGIITFDNYKFKARLVDLPCIVESLKTTDKKTFYKTADICQMLVCKPYRNDDDKNYENYNTGGLFSSDEDESKIKQDKQANDNNNNNNHDPNKKYQWLHGIAAPLKNARKKRFRKVAKKKIIDYAEIEAEVKRLFKADCEAIKVHYEFETVVEDEQENIMLDTKSQTLNNDDDTINNNGDETTNMELNKTGSEKNTLLGLNSDDESNDMIVRERVVNASSTGGGGMSASANVDSSKYKKKSSFNMLLGDFSGSSSASDDDYDENNEDDDLVDSLINIKGGKMSILSKKKKKKHQREHDDDEYGDDDEHNNDYDVDDDDDNDDDDDGDDESKEIDKQNKIKNISLMDIADDTTTNFDLNDAKTSIVKTKMHYEFNEDSNLFDEPSNDRVIMMDDDDARAGDDDDDDGGDEQEHEEEDEEGDDNDDDEYNLDSLLKSDNQDTNADHMSKLMDDLDRVRLQRQKQEDEINSIKNPSLKMHLLPLLEELVEEEKKISNEIEKLEITIGKKK